VIGVENGYAAGDSIAVSPGDGFNASERRAVLARTKARVEAIRGLEFTGDVDLRVISRAEYRNRSRGNRSDAYRAWNNQVWEALFIVDEETDVADAFDSTLGAAVLGFYADGEIVIVSDSETPTIDTRTLAHELVHALQGERGWLRSDRATQDGQLARNGLVEGDANVVEARYEQRCGAEWDCVEPPERRDGGGRFNRGLLLTLLTPYVEGPDLIASLRERGWSAVDDAYDRLPETTEQVIHPENYPDEGPVPVTVADRSADEWRRFDLEPAADRVGEASIYAMFWANGVTGDHPQYRYDYPLSDGWGGDAVVPYTNGSAYGYVWRTVWDSPEDARSFHEGYRELLRNHNATRDGAVWVVPESDPYADAFRVTREGRAVTIVNAPTVGTLDAVHASSPSGTAADVVGDGPRPLAIGAGSNSIGLFHPFRDDDVAFYGAEGVGAAPAAAATLRPSRRARPTSSTG